MATSKYTKFYHGSMCVTTSTALGCALLTPTVLQHHLQPVQNVTVNLFRMNIWL